MKNSKLASLLSKLSVKEFKEFGKFVKSPYFNSNSNIIKLYELISKAFPDFESPKLTKENIYSYVYTDEHYNDSTVRGLLAAALKLGEEFLTVSHLKQDDYHYKDFLMSELAARKIFDLFNIHLRNIRKELEETPSKDDDYFFVKYRVETLISQIESKSYIPLTQKDIPGDMHTKDTDNLLNYFLISILKRYNYLLTKTGSLNVSHDFKFFDQILDYLSKTDISQVPVLNFQYNRAMLYVSDMSEKYFQVLRNILFDNYEDLDPSERYNLFSTLQNYCVRNKQITGEVTSEAQHELYKFAIKNNILTFDEYEPMHHILFSNIVSSFLSKETSEAAREFLESKLNLLAKERRKSAENFNLAKIYFNEKKYDKVLEHLSRVQNDDVFYKAAIKNLYSMTYYELNYIEELVLQLDSYRSFLNSNVVIGQRLIDNHMNFVNTLTKIIKLKDIGEKSEIEYLLHETQLNESFNSQLWLLEKIKELL